MSLNAHSGLCLLRGTFKNGRWGGTKTLCARSVRGDGQMVVDLETRPSPAYPQNFLGFVQLACLVNPLQAILS
jgi:hypothetical protein